MEVLGKTMIITMIAMTCKGEAKKHAMMKIFD